MTSRELRQEVRTEFGQLKIVVEELDALAEDIGSGPATRRERAAAGAFLGSLYMGVENVLKRIARYNGVELPSGDRWHAELFMWYCEAPKGRPELPVLFPGELADEVRPYRRFRHVSRHAYPVELDWSKMEEGLRQARRVLERFREEVEQYLAAIEQ